MESMTQNQPSVIDEGAFTVRRTIRIAAPVATVWRTVTQPDQISKWFGRTELDRVGAGAVGTISFPDYGAVPLRVEAFDEPRLVRYRWNNDDALGTHPAELDASTATEFTFELEEVDGGTQLTVVESGFERTSDPRANLAAHGEGWTSELDKLVALLEGGA